MSRWIKSRNVTRISLAVFTAMLGAVVVVGCSPSDSTLWDLITGRRAESVPQLKLDAVTPAKGACGGGTTVMLTGTSFTADMDVLFGGFLGQSPQMVDAGTFIVTTPPQAPGMVNVTVRAKDGTQSTLESAFEYMPWVEAEGGPRLVSAISTGNTGVLVTFNESVGQGAEDPANYSIMQANVNSESAVLLVLAAIPSEDRLTVALTTASQNGVTYELHVTGIKDLAGNPLAAPTPLLDPTRVQFAGTPPAVGGVDSDGDGLTDAEEQYGWEVLVELVNKTTIRRTVTSDPYRADTDGDGLTDREEKAIGSDPRLADTDGDMVPDAEEWNQWNSDPADQDTDNDGLSDSLELYFGTSPILADTDGDQLSDSVELIERNRNPLLADLPLPQITVGDIRLDLKITSSYTDEKGQSHEVTDSRSTSFAQSRSDKLGTSDTNSTEQENTSSQKFGVEGGYGGEEVGWYCKVSSEAGWGQRRTRGFSSTVDHETARSSQEEYQQSVANALTKSERREVTRNIDQALIQAGVNIANRSDIAFTVTNLEISVQQQDRRSGRGFRPIATLRPAGATDPASQPKYNLGPFDPERGPVIFQNVDVFPNLVDDLMREPTGLIFQVVNFDILDEFGRNFVFSSQEVNDRTAGITIDFGDGTVESFRVATHNRFDSSGRPLGISMQRALEIAGIAKAAGPDQPLAPSALLPESVRKTYASLVDNQGVERLTRIRGTQNDLVGVPEAEKRFWAVIASTPGLSPDVSFSSIPLHAGEDYLLCYTRDVDKDNLFEREEHLYGSSDRNPDTDGDGLDDYFEVRIGWTVNRIPGLPYKTFSDPARANSDGDTLRDDQERTVGTDPNRDDTDEDALPDGMEVTESLEIILFDGDADDSNNKLLVLTPYSSWAIIDGGNGTANTTAKGDDIQVVAVGSPVQPGDVVIEPGPNGVLDSVPAGDDISSLAEAIVCGPDGACASKAAGDDVQVDFTGKPPAGPGQVLIRAGLNGRIDSVPVNTDWIRVVHPTLCTTDPLNRDTDYDGIPDGREVLIGTNPNCRDAGKVIDSDGDGLFDNEEDAGWDVVVYNSAGVPTMTHVTSNKLRADTDLDGLPDVYERAIGSNPRSSDTDGDGLFDLAEFDPEDTDHYYSVGALQLAARRCSEADHCQAPEIKPLAERLRSNVCRQDTDGDGLTDYLETKQGWQVTVARQPSHVVFSKAYLVDSDGDGLTDLQEYRGKDNNPNTPADATDPSLADTDEDSVNDNIEVARGSNPLAKDKYLRFTFLSVQCTRADDAYDASCACYDLDMYYNLYVKKVTEINVDSLSNEQMGEGDTHTFTNKIYDYIINEDETVSVYTRDVYDYDQGSPNDYFPDFNVPYRYESTYPLLDESQTQDNPSNGTIVTHWKVEDIHGVPGTSHLTVDN